LSEPGTVESADVVIVGGGAAGLATSIFCKRHSGDLRVVCLDGARRVGAKILVSGGSRCNVTNRTVSERDFWGGSSRIVRSVLRAFPVEKTIRFFRDIGVDLHEEEDGKLFPDSNSSRTVVESLLREMSRLGVNLRCGERVVAVRQDGDAFRVATASGRQFGTRAVVLATGGRALPKSGSDGGGYALAAALGHGYVPTTPALAPLLLEGERHAELSGVAVPARLTVRVEGKPDVKLEGALLWTHFGASGPVVLDASRHWHRARLETRAVDVLLSFCPGETFESLDAWLLDMARTRARALVATVLATRLPAAVSESCVRAAGLERVTMAHLAKDERRRLIQLLLAMPLSIVDSRGYAFAEATAGGVPLDEIDAASMGSLRCPGLYLVGEILDVDGRLGGFNFQWAWSSAWVAGRALASALQTHSPNAL
jgi:predicted Rossmann fold flavoprotein